MRKQDILKMHGLTEAEFYKRYPTEEAYKMAMGGYKQQGGPSFVPPVNAIKVDQPGTGYNMIPGQDPNASKLYFDKQIEAAKKSATPGTPEDKQKYQDFLVKQAQSGIHPDELVKKGYIDPSMKDKLMQYYKPVYTEKVAQAKPNMPMDVSDRIDRKEIFPTGQQAFRTFMYPDVDAGYSKSTQRYFDSTGNKEIDVTKSFDAQGNFKPVYIESDKGALGVLKQTRGTLDDAGNIQQTQNTVTPAFSAGFKQGGPLNAFNMWAPDFANPEFLMKKGGDTPCFDCGGMHKMQGGGDPSIPTISSKDSLNMFRDVIKKMGGPAYPGQTQNNILESKKNDFMQYIKSNTMNAIAREENNAFQNFMQMGGNPNPYGNNPYMQNQLPSGSTNLSPNPSMQYGFNPNMMNQNMFMNAANLGKNSFRNDMNTFFGATQNLMQAQYGAETYWNYQGNPNPQFTTPESVGMQNDNVMMQGQTDQAYPITSGQPFQQKKPATKNYSTRTLEPEVNWGIAGMNAISSAFELAQARKNEEKFKSLQGADNQFYSMPQGNRGDYDQFGNFRPNQKVPVQFAGQNYGAMGTNYTFQQGGEYYMTDDQINAIMKAGGQVEFLD